MLLWTSDLQREVFFFFQAEDGIRDTSVTGVQTCALPISRHRSRRGGRGYRAWSEAPRRARSVARRRWRRSEERRVGKSAERGGGRIVQNENGTGRAELLRDWRHAAARTPTCAGVDSCRSD